MWLEHIRRRGWQAVAAVEVAAAQAAQDADTAEPGPELGRNWAWN